MIVLGLILPLIQHFGYDYIYSLLANPSKCL